jgi:hypothetical protein
MSHRPSSPGHRDLAITAYLTAEELARLDAVASAEDASRSWTTRRLIRIALDAVSSEMAEVRS